MSESTQIPWVVLKFGGTSVATCERWKTIAEVLERRIEAGERPLVVCSALSGVSNLLEQLLQEAVVGRHEAVLDRIWSKHEQLGASLDTFDPLLVEAATLLGSQAPDQHPA